MQFAAVSGTTACGGGVGNTFFQVVVRGGKLGNHYPGWLDLTSLVAFQNCGSDRPNGSIWTTQAYFRVLLVPGLIPERESDGGQEISLRKLRPFSKKN